MTRERTQQTLDGQWRFQVDRDERGEERGYHRREYGARGWLKVPVPGSWDSYLPELFGYAGHAWYRRSFRAQASWRGMRVHLRFEGANYETAVWLNGCGVGSHVGGFDPFEIDVTGLVDWQAVNTLAVRVDNWPRADRIPSSLGGWWNYGGIFRSVSLLALPPVRIADIFVRAGPGQDGSPARLQADVTVINEGPEPVEIAVAASVHLGERPVRVRGELRASLSLAPGATASAALSGLIARARPWTPSHPSLYTLRAELSHGRRVLDKLDVGFGVRRFEVRGTQLLLNGEPLTVTGFNRHEEYAGTGRVDPGGVLEADLQLIKRLGGNMVRMHYQAHPDLYDLADRLGLLVFAEIPLWGYGHGDPAAWSDPAAWRMAERTLRTLIAGLRNHPSVVIWSVGNECGTDLVESRPLIAHLVEVARSLDGTRPIAYVGFRGPEEKVYDLVDLPCHNQYFGLRTAELGEHFDAIHALTPGKPLLATEFGHEAVLGLRGQGYGTEDEQVRVLQANWEVIRSRQDYMPGGLIWCLADYWHMPCGPDHDWLNRLYFGHGVTSLGRQPKLACAAVRRMWQEGTGQGIT